MKALAWLRGPALSPADTPRLLAAQLALLDGNVGTSLRASTLAAWLTAGAFWFTLDDSRVVWWAVWATLLCAAGCFVHRRLPRPEGPDGEATAGHYLRVMGWVCLGFGGTWGALPLLFIDPARLYVLNLALTLLGAGTAWLLTGSVIVALAVAIVLVLSPSLVLRRLRARRIEHVEQQLPDALQMLAGTARAGPTPQCSRSAATLPSLSLRMRKCTTEPLRCSSLATRRLPMKPVAPVTK